MVDKKNLIILRLVYQKREGSLREFVSENAGIRSIESDLLRSLERQEYTWIQSGPEREYDHGRQTTVQLTNANGMPQVDQVVKTAHKINGLHLRVVETYIPLTMEEFS